MVYNSKSLLESAVELLKEKKTPKDLQTIIKEVMPLNGYSVEDTEQYAPQFILDFMCSGYFWYCGDGKYDLKERQFSSTLDSDRNGIVVSEDETEVTQNELGNDFEIAEELNVVDDDDDDDDLTIKPSKKESNYEQDEEDEAEEDEEEMDAIQKSLANQ